MSSAPPGYGGSIPEFYERILRALFFEPYARDLARRLRIHPAMHVLEVACGTGIVTRALLGVLPGDAALVATDINEDMLRVARARVSPEIQLAFQQADAMALPFDPGSFDAVICQFGLMFFADKRKGVREMHRVLKRGGQLLLSTWDAVERNPIAQLMNDVIARVFPENTPGFFQVPFHMHSIDELQALARDAGFRNVTVERVECEGQVPSVAETARGLVLGTPLGTEIRERGASLEHVIQEIEQALVAQYGRGPFTVPQAALLVMAVA